MGSSGYRYDAFISHAVEDKIPIANELCERLEQAGLRIWYSGKELNTGDSINNTIHTGLEESQYGIIVFSQHYIKKTWTLREFYILLGKENHGRKVILPVLYDVTPEDLALKDLTMADRFAVRADRGMDHVVDKLLKAMHQQTIKKTIRKSAVRGTWIIAAVLSLVLLVFGFYEIWGYGGPADDVVQREVHARIEQLQHRVENQYLATLKSAGARPSETAAVDTFFIDFKNLKAYYRNEYEFFNGYTTLRARKNVEAALRLDLSACDPANAYQLQDPIVYLIGERPEVRYAFLSTQPLRYDLSKPEKIADHVYSVTATYENNIRLIAVNLLFVKSQQETKRHRMMLIGFLPRETYIFEEQEGSWSMTEVR